MKATKLRSIWPITVRNSWWISQHARKPAVINKAASHRKRFWKMAGLIIWLQICLRLFLESISQCLSVSLCARAPKGIFKIRNAPLSLPHAKHYEKLHVSVHLWSSAVTPGVWAHRLKEWGMGEMTHSREGKRGIWQIEVIRRGIKSGLKRWIHSLNKSTKIKKTKNKAILLHFVFVFLVLVCEVRTCAVEQK